VDAHIDINAVFAGGGVKGIALAGAAAGALEAGCRFSHVVGTSSGALVASLVAAGYDADELDHVLMRVPWHDLFHPLPWRRLPIIGRGLSILMAKAQYRGDRLESIWRELLAAKGVTTFGDIPTAALRIVTTDLTRQQGVVWPDHLPQYGHDPASFPVARAVRMSAAVPFYVPPVRLTDPRTGETSEFVDGALTSNFPLIVGRWSNVWPIVGFRFREEDDPPRLTFRGPAALARGVVTASISAADALRTPRDGRGRVIIKIPLGGDPLDFDVSPARAREMFEIGRAEARRVLVGTELLHPTTGHESTSGHEPEPAAG
jgi:NTE family protein